MKIEKIKMAMVSAISHALDYARDHPGLSNDKVLEAVLDELKLSFDLKRIAAAAIIKALNYRESGMSDKEIMGKVMDESDELIKNAQGE
ncbi:MAG: hypothetical protein QXS07_00900 [Candidatus Pacearchaeota archaeon]